MISFKSDSQLRNPDHPNMKELRYEAHDRTQIWRALFAFDPKRKAIVLVAGAKQGTDEAKFYKDLLRVANRRYDRHLEALTSEEAQTRAMKRSHSRRKTGPKEGKRQ